MKILFVTDLYPIINDKKIPKVIEDFALAFKEKGNEISVLRPNFILNALISPKLQVKTLDSETWVKVPQDNTALFFFT